ncbi:MAG: sigma-54-dependent Fis family transcriptional regulator [Planctomycetales bacterium]|nr:sigma-54-dependent Fis family transcriptional regulator [Planctomycetales bacterium]
MEAKTERQSSCPGTLGVEPNAAAQGVFSLLADEQHTFVGQSTQMQHVLEQIEWISRSDAPVLITGESGTGKEVVARMVHASSHRSRLQYVRVNCAALSETLIESELFGHEKGAFTGASEERVGRFEWAGKGTLLLDEISEIPLALQAKLLRVLEEDEFERVGSNQSRPMQARVIATSNRCLREEVEKGNFRKDLYYRLNVLETHIPALRERRDDIPLLVMHFIKCFQHEGRGEVSSVEDAAMDLLCHYEWPGNVRELRNAVRRLCIVNRRSCVTRDSLSFLDAHSETCNRADDLYDMTLRDAERLLVRATMRRYQGNRSEVARHLGVTSRTLHNWFKQDPDLLADVA